MKRFMLNYMIFVLTMMIFQNTHGQDGIQNLRNIDWPLTNFKGQISIEGDLRQYIANNRRNDQGDTEALRDEGSTYSATISGINVRYGIMDNIELMLGFDHQNEISRKLTMYIFSFNQPSQYISTLEQTKGFGDLDLRISYKWPKETESYDIKLSVGGSLPMAKAGEKEPLHEAFYDSEFDLEEINLHYIYGSGRGVLQLLAGGEFKYRLSKNAFHAWYYSRIPNGAATVETWTSVKNGYDFEHESIEVERQFPMVTQFGVESEFQISPFFSILGGYSNFSTSGGWFEQGDSFIEEPSTSLGSLNLGYFLIVSTNIWLRQNFGIPIHGNNTYSPLQLEASFTYNLFK